MDAIIRHCPTEHSSNAARSSQIDQFNRITTDMLCIRNLRLTVRRVLEALATYPDRAELKREYSELEDQDIRATNYRGGRPECGRVSLGRTTRVLGRGLSWERGERWGVRQQPISEGAIALCDACSTNSPTQLCGSGTATGKSSLNDYRFA